MTDTVPTTTDKTQRETRRADELKPGDWLSAAETGTDDPAEVIAVHPFDERVLVVIRDAEGELHTSKEFGVHQLELATDADVAEARDDRSRYAVADQLRHLAETIDGAERLPSPQWPRRVQVQLQLRDIAEVARVADELGLKVEVDTAGRNRAFWPAERTKDTAVVAEWFQYDPDFEKAEPVTVAGMVAARELDDDEPEPIPDGVSGSAAGAPAGRETFTRHFSFGHGQTDPETGENLLDKYVTVIAPTADGCRQAMFASRFGEAWAFEYIPGQPQTDEWLPQWTEHDRIVVESGGE